MTETNRLQQGWTFRLVWGLRICKGCRSFRQWISLKRIYAAHHQEIPEGEFSESQQVPNDYNVTKTYGVFKAAKDKSSKASTGYAGQTRFLSVRSLQRMSFTRGLKCSILYCWSYYEYTQQHGLSLKSPVIAWYPLLYVAFVIQGKSGPKSYTKHLTKGRNQIENHLIIKRDKNF